MSFRGRPARDAAEQAFVGGASPSASRGQKKPITLTVEPEMLARIDALARRRGISRVALMVSATSQALEEAGV